MDDKWARSCATRVNSFPPQCNHNPPAAVCSVPKEQINAFPSRPPLKIDARRRRSFLISDG